MWISDRCSSSFPFKLISSLDDPPSQLTRSQRLRIADIREIVRARLAARSSSRSRAAAGKPFQTPSCHNDVVATTADQPSVCDARVPRVFKLFPGIPWPLP